MKWSVLQMIVSEDMTVLSMIIETVNDMLSI